MPNLSKARDPRFWRKWRMAGAVGSIHSAITRTPLKLTNYQLIGQEQGEKIWHTLANYTIPVQTVLQALKLEGADQFIKKWLEEHHTFAVWALASDGFWRELDRTPTNRIWHNFSDVVKNPCMEIPA